MFGCSLRCQSAVAIPTRGSWRCRVQGRYDRIHVGASCPLEHLGRLTALLGPEGGCIVTPVAPSDLRLISVSPDGVTTQRVLSQVRYGELEVRRGLHALQCLLELPTERLWSLRILLGNMGSLASDQPSTLQCDALAERASYHVVTCCAPA